MKLTVTAANKSDILRDQALYEAQKKARDEASDAAYMNYEDALNAVFQPSIDAIKAALGDDLGDLNIKMERRYGNISVEFSNGSGPRRSENASLKWDWRASLNPETGEITKQSSSCSGLEATTPGQIEDLKQCVRQLEIINNLDWYSLLNLNIPKYSDYSKDIPTIDPELNKRNFNQELRDAELEELIGARVLVKTNTRAYVSRYYRGIVYIGILKDSGTQYTIFELPGYAVDKILENGSYKYSDTLTFNSLGEYVDFAKDPIRVKKENVQKGVIWPLERVEY